MEKILLDLPSPVERLFFRNRLFFLKRDDRVHPDFSGNKSRKFHYYLDHDFPHIHTVRSCGSNQSNAMYSLSVLAKMRGWRFEYRIDHLPDFLRDNPHGNYAAALANGMRIVMEDEGWSLNDGGVLRIEEGGRQAEAEYGIKILAQEIATWQQQEGIEHLDVFLPSGTGTTALYLQKSLYTLQTATTRGAPLMSTKALQSSAHPKSTRSTRVVTTPCVGDVKYLRQQFGMLEPDTRYHPTILDLPRKYHFGKLYREFYEIWIELRQDTGVEFDLLYDPKGWKTLTEHRGQLGEHILYIHQGGLQGNESMLRRYQRKHA